MPLWTINHTAGLFTDEEKQNLAVQITDLYVSFGLPAFYVNIQFTPFTATDIYVGHSRRSTSDNPFAFIAISHFARQFESTAQRQGFLDRVDGILTDRFTKKGMDWEYITQETPLDLWRINGLTPPKPRSEEEALWKKHNRPVALKGNL